MENSEILAMRVRLKEQEVALAKKNLEIAELQLALSKSTAAEGDNATVNEIDDDEAPSSTDMQTGQSLEEKPFRKSIKNSGKYKVQRIDPKNPTVPIAVYDSPIEATRQVEGAVKSSIHSAIKNCTLYLGSRWWTVDHGEDETRVHDMPATVSTRFVTKGLVAKLNRDGTVIKQVFSSQREAMKEAGLSSPAAICHAMKKNTASHGHLYRNWTDCDADLQASYVEKYGEPVVEKTSHGTKIARVNPKDNKVEEIFTSTESVMRAYQMGWETVKDAIRTGEVKRGYIWREVED